MPTPPIEPSSPASGTQCRIVSPAKDIATLNSPISTIAAMPTCHATIAASCAGIFAFAAMNAGPRTVSAIPIVDGESSPSGIAVTSSRPVCFATRNASHV